MIHLSIYVTTISYDDTYDNVTTTTFAIIHIHILFSAITIIVGVIIFISTTITTTIITMIHCNNATVTRVI